MTDQKFGILNNVLWFISAIFCEFTQFFGLLQDSCKYIREKMQKKVEEFNYVRKLQNRKKK